MCVPTTRARTSFTPLPFLPTPPPPQSHTIILLQTSTNTQSRTYLDFDTQGKAMDAIVRMYEERLKAITPMAKNITYDVQDLFRYLDALTDISALTCVRRRGDAAHESGAQEHSMRARGPEAPPSPPSLPLPPPPSPTPRSLDAGRRVFVPMDKEGIKVAVFDHLKRMAGGR